MAVFLKKVSLSSPMVHIDTARYCESEIEVDIDELEAEVDSGDYTGEEIRNTRCFKCLGCELRLIPKGIDPKATEVPGKEVRHPSPHFAIKVAKSTHDDECDIDGYLNFANTQAGKRTYPEYGGFPFGYPSKLVLTTSTQVPSTLDTNNLSAVSKQSSLLGKDHSQGVTREKNKTVKTLKLLVKHFLSFPEEEYRNLPLTVPGVGLSTYKDVFHRLCWRPGYEYKAVRIYFAELLWKYTDIGEHKIYLPTVEGDWSKGPPTKSLYLELDMENWGDTSKRLTKRWIESCVKKAKYPEKQKAWVFFLGNQVEGNDLKFQLFENDFRLVYCVNDEVDVLRNETRSWIAEKLLPEVFSGELEVATSNNALEPPSGTNLLSMVSDDTISSFPDQEPSTENPKPESVSLGDMVFSDPEVLPIEEPEPNIENSEILDELEDGEPQESELTGDSQPESDTDLPAAILPPSEIPPDEIPQPITETPESIGLPKNREPQENEVTDVTKEKSLLEKLTSLPILLAIFLVLSVAGLTVVVQEKNRDSQPTEEVK